MMMRDTRSRPLEPHTNSGHYSHGRPLGHSKSRVFVEQFDIVNSVCVLKSLNPLKLYFGQVFHMRKLAPIMMDLTQPNFLPDGQSLSRRGH